LSSSSVKFIFHSVVFMFELIDFLTKLLNVPALSFDCVLVLVFDIEVMVHCCKRVEAKAWSEGVHMADGRMLGVESEPREGSNAWMVRAIIRSEHCIAWVKLVSEPRPVWSWDTP
jgi:hypothetical protein